MAEKRNAVLVTNYDQSLDVGPRTVRVLEVINTCQIQHHKRQPVCPEALLKSALMCTCFAFHLIELALHVTQSRLCCDRY